MVFTFTAMVISPIDFPMYPVSDVSENQSSSLKVTFYNGAFFKSFRKNFRFF
ncbi:hypothetical protein VS84_00749 [Vibrio cholerae]|nr:hypothetical protein VS84_00749 [Vibrio cholerae]KKP21400.1 hypothetical protein VS86_00046 [Vibrio cholerae]